MTVSAAIDGRWYVITDNYVHIVITVFYKLSWKYVLAHYINNVRVHCNSRRYVYITDNVRY